MKKFLEIFFITLGVIFFIIILIGVYLFVVDPYGIKPLLKNLTSGSVSTAVTAPTPEVGVAPKKNPLITSEQERLLKAVGVDPATLPSKITPAMEQCFYTKLGATRVAEIKKIGAPSIADYLAARSCL